MVFYQIVSHKLLDSERFQGQNLALHLIVVAATTPSDEVNGTYSPNFSPWIHLAQKLVKVNLFQCLWLSIIWEPSVVEQHLLPHYCEPTTGHDFAKYVIRADSTSPNNFGHFCLSDSPGRSLAKNTKHK